MPALGILGVVLLAFAFLLIFVGLCMGDHCDWSEDGKFLFWLIVVGVGLIIAAGEGG